MDEGVRRAWSAAVHAVLRAARPPGRPVGEVQGPEPGCNHYGMAVDLGGGRRRLLLNAAMRAVGCSAEEAPGGPLRFRPVPGSEVFLAAGFQVPPVDVLEAPLRSGDVAVLDADERADIAYHQPGRIGDVLFNRFD